MTDSVTEAIYSLYKDNNWQKILNNYHDAADTCKVLWVFPSEDNVKFIADSLQTRGVKELISIGCGSGLLEWIIMEATDVPGVTARLLTNRSTALLFCYFNNGPAFHEYVQLFSGDTLVIVGPGEGRQTHTDPTPFNPGLSDSWRLEAFQEVRDSRDFIAIYYR